jgi:DNA-directed RNA polymerase specialized sigma24 family protein
MGFNYAREKRKFNKEWNEKERWYRESGMSEDAIREMYEYDWSEFNSTRKFYRYGDDDVDVESIAEEDGDSIDKTFSEEWIELLETPNLVRKVRKLPADYIEIIDLMVLEKLTQKEIAGRMNCSQQNIAKKIEKIRKLLR